MARFIIGFMGAGKSRYLTENSQYYRATFDMDVLLSERFGISIWQVFDQYGEAVFRQAEKALLEELLPLPDTVLVATGGGIIEDSQNRTLLAAQHRKNIWLDNSFDCLYERLRHERHEQRPIFRRLSREALADVYDKRRPWYEQCGVRLVY